MSSGHPVSTRSIVGVVLAAGALPAVGADELRGDDAASGQLRALGDELVSCQGAAAQHLAGAVDRMNLDHALGQIGADANGFTSYCDS